MALVAVSAGRGRALRTSRRGREHVLHPGSKPGFKTTWGSRLYDVDEIRRRITIADFLRRENCKVGRRNRANCPFCKGNSRGTFSFTQNEYHCFRCLRGGDIFSLYQELHQCNFLTAIKELAAITDVDAVDTDRAQLDERSRQCALQAQAALEFRWGLRDLRLHYRKQIYCYERILHETRERMNVAGISKEDWETCGNIVSLALDELREAVAAYFLLSFGTISEQREFHDNPEWRPTAINGLLARGIVRDDQGHAMEVSLP
jgi:hypothetical protein